MGFFRSLARVASETQVSWPHRRQLGMDGARGSLCRRSVGLSDWKKSEVQGDLFYMCCFFFFFSLDFGRSDSALELLIC